MIGENKRVTIKDVAKKLGLSPTTVSRVINNHPYVSEEKNLVVKRAMEELGYVPNYSAQNLRNKKTNLIAVLVPRIANPFFSTLIEGMDNLATKRGYQVIICQTNYNPQKELDFLNLLKKKQVEGIILTSIENDWSALKPYTNYGPIVLTNEYDKKANLPSVVLNQFKGGYIGTRHLIEQGHKRIAYCSGGNRNVASEREKGFIKALNEESLIIKKDWFFYDAYSVADGEQILLRILSMVERPTAVFTGSDEVAAGMIIAAKRHGVRIPEDLAVIGFDNQSLSELIDPQITTIHQPTAEIGQKAMEVILDIIQYTKPLSKEIIELPLKLIVRDSTFKK